MKDAQVGWSKDKYRALVTKYNILREWQPELPEKGQTPIDCPADKICLYEAYFVERFISAACVKVFNFRVAIVWCAYFSDESLWSDEGNAF